MKKPGELRSSLEPLESRIAPANITATVVDHILKIVGSDVADTLTIDGVVGDATAFTLTTTGGSTINGAPGPFTSATGVTGISIKTLDGDDSVTFSSAVAALNLKGSLKINGGEGANSVFSTDLTVGKNITILNGAHDTGASAVILINPSVAGSVTIRNADGDTSTHFFRTTAGVSTIGGNLTIVNGRGRDVCQVVDVNIGHNFIARNGHADDAGDPGSTKIYNLFNTTSRSVVRGNIVFSYLDGDGTGNGDYDGIWDTAVLGNVTINHGSGSFAANFDAYQTSLPVIVRGNLTMKGSGANTITVGTQYQQVGLIIGKNLSITSGGGMDLLTLNKLEVGGATRLLLGDGGSTVTIDDSTFAGTFKLVTDAGADTVNLDTTAGSSRATIFEKPVLIRQGSGNDTLLEVGGADANQFLIVESTFVVHHGAGADSRSLAPSHELFPFHNSIQWII